MNDDLGRRQPRRLRRQPRGAALPRRPARRGHRGSAPAHERRGPRPPAPTPEHTASSRPTSPRSAGPSARTSAGSCVRASSSRTVRSGRLVQGRRPPARQGHRRGRAARGSQARGAADARGRGPPGPRARADRGGPDPSRRPALGPHAQAQQGGGRRPLQGRGPVRSGTTHVRIIGTGLIGTSLGIALSANGFRVSLGGPVADRPSLARDLGPARSRPRVDDEPDLVVVAAPPTSPRSRRRSPARWPRAVVTDVASVKEDGARRGAGGRASTPPATSVRTHGRARAIRRRRRPGDLFDGRAWVVVPHRAPTEMPSRRSAGGHRGRLGRAGHAGARARRGGAAVSTCPSSPRASSPPACVSCPSCRRPRGSGPARRDPHRGERPPALDPDPRRQRPGGPRRAPERARPGRRRRRGPRLVSDGRARDRSAP